jgi:predicted phosphohydrolase
VGKGALVDTSSIFLIGALVLVIVWNVFLSVYIYRINAKNNLFFDDSSKNLRELVTRSITDQKTLNQRINKDEASIEEIVKIIQGSYQKFAMVRYNPFRETGGDQSFSMALLDLRDNGIVITSIHGREVDRIYAKEIINGKSKHNLSAEEIEAIKGATGAK